MVDVESVNHKTFPTDSRIVTSLHVVINILIIIAWSHTNFIFYWCDLYQSHSPAFVRASSFSTSPYMEHTFVYVQPFKSFCNLSVQLLQDPPRIQLPADSDIRRFLVQFQTNVVSLQQLQHWTSKQFSQSSLVTSRHTSSLAFSFLFSSFLTYSIDKFLRYTSYIYFINFHITINSFGTQKLIQSSKFIQGFTLADIWS